MGGGAGRASDNEMFGHTLMTTSEQRKDDDGLVLENGHHIEVKRIGNHIYIGCVGVTLEAWKLLKFKVDRLLLT